MQESRVSSAATFHPAHGWVFTSGGTGTSSKWTTERTWNGRLFESYLEMQMPIALNSHSIVALDDGGESHFFVTGGEHRGSPTNKTFIYQGGKWISAADMPTARLGKRDRLIPNAA